MANVGGDQNFLGRVARDYQVGIGESAGFKSAVNYGPVGPIFKCLALAVAQTKAPSPLVVTCDVWDRIWLLWQRIEMRLQRRERYLLARLGYRTTCKLLR